MVSEKVSDACNMPSSSFHFSAHMDLYVVGIYSKQVLPQLRFYV